MGVLGSIGKGALQTITGNVETAQIILHDYRRIAENSGVMELGSALSGSIQTALSNERIAATKAALSSGGPPSYPNSDDRTFKVQFNPSEMTVNASSTPVNVKDPTDDKARSITVDDPSMTLTVVLYFDEMDTYDCFMTEKFTSGLSATGIANGVKMVADILGLKKVKSVRPQVEGFVAALRNPFTRTISFRWADFSFIGQLSAVQARYTMFSNAGHPVRAEVVLRLKHEMDPTMLHNWYNDYEKAFEGDGLLKKAANLTGNILNLNV